MNKISLNIKGHKQKILNPFKSVYHAPLIVDADNQSSYRRAGHVSWPGTKMLQEKQDSIEKLRGIFRWFWSIIPFKKTL